MKRLLLLYSLIILTVSVIAQDQHSNIKLDCSFCHACENPTKVNPCLKACPREEMITVYHSPSEGPSELVIDVFKESEDLYEPVLFTHYAHAEMAGMTGGCETCHHYNPPGSIASCRDCHSISRQRTELDKPDLKGAYHRQCIDCHRTWKSNVACADCHLLKGKKGKEEFDPKKEIKKIHPDIVEPDKIVYETVTDKGKYVTFFHNNHTDLFNLNCGDCHKNQSCAKCHKENGEMRDVKLTVEEKHFICSSCHNTESNCEFCHKQSEMKSFNHGNRTGFVLKSFHAKLSCEKCHKASPRFTGLTAACSSCHGEWNVDNFNHAVTGLRLDEIHIENDCEACHSTPTYSSPRCDMCHDDIGYPKELPGERIK